MTLVRSLLVLVLVLVLVLLLAGACAVVAAGAAAEVVVAGEIVGKPRRAVLLTRHGALLR